MPNSKLPDVYIEAVSCPIGRPKVSPAVSRTKLCDCVLVGAAALIQIDSLREDITSNEVTINCNFM